MWIDPNAVMRITAAFGGALLPEHAAACAHAKATAMQRVAAPFDVVLTSNSGYPLDQNLYQAVKGMSAAAKVVKPGGTIICAAECRDGLPAHGSFGQVLASAPTPRALLDMICAPGYSVPDQWQVQIQAQILLKASVRIKADGLEADALRAAHLTPIDDVTTAVRDALRLPAVGVEALEDVLAPGHRGGAVELDPVVVVEVDEPAEPEVAGERGGLRSRGNLGRVESLRFRPLMKRWCGDYPARFAPILVYKDTCQ